MSKITSSDPTHILCRIATEIFLKGKNQRQFISKLQGNIQRQTKQEGISPKRGRITIPYFKEHHLLQRVFGLQSYSPAVFIQAVEDHEQMLSKVKETLQQLTKRMQGTFRVQTKRSDKRFPLTSVQVNHEIGKHLEASNLKVTFQLKNPEHVFGVEITEKGTYVYSEYVSCPGGLPAGIEGKAVIEIQGAAEVLAAYLVMKRGVEITFIKNDQFTKYQALLQSVYPTPLQTTSSIKSYQERLEKTPCVIILGDTIENFTENKDLQKTSNNLMYLAPLVAWSKDQIKKEITKIKKRANII